MGQFVIAAYRPREGRAADLLQLVREHLPVLRRERLATDRPSYVMRASDGTLLEVFEWTSGRAVEEAHHNRAVQELWARFHEACEYVGLASLAESQGPFAAFEPVDL